MNQHNAPWRRESKKERERERERGKKHFIKAGTEKCNENNATKPSMRTERCWGAGGKASVFVQPRGKRRTVTYRRLATDGFPRACASTNAPVLGTRYLLDILSVSLGRGAARVSTSSLALKMGNLRPAQRKENGVDAS